MGRDSTARPARASVAPKGALGRRILRRLGPVVDLSASVDSRRGRNASIPGGAHDRRPTAHRTRARPVAGAVPGPRCRSRRRRNASPAANGGPSHLRRPRAGADAPARRRARERDALGRVVREGGREVAGRGGTDRHRGRSAGGHARGRDPEGTPEPRHGRLDTGRPLRRAGAGLRHRVPERPVPGRPLRLASRPTGDDRHGGAADEPQPPGDDPAAADDRPRGGRARGCRGLRRPVAG